MVLLGHQTKGMTIFVYNGTQHCFGRAFKKKWQFDPPIYATKT